MNSNNKKVFIVVCILAFIAIVVVSFKIASTVSGQLAAIGVTKAQLPFKGGTSVIPGNDPRHQNAKLSSIMIRGNGDVQLMGITVQSKNGKKLIATGSVGEETLTFIISTNNQTVVKSGAAISSPDAIVAGSIITVTGSFQEFSADVNVLAKEIRIGSGKTTSTL